MSLEYKEEAAAVVRALERFMDAKIADKISTTHRDGCDTIIKRDDLLKMLTEALSR